MHVVYGNAHVWQQHLTHTWICGAFIQGMPGPPTPEDKLRKCAGVPQHGHVRS